MQTRITLIVLFLAFLASEANAQSHQNRRRGVILGGLAGAAIGVAIGDKGDNETAGALIGGAVGAIAGGTIGNQRDQQINHNLRYHSPYGVPYSGNRYSGAGPGYSRSGSAPSYYQPHVYEPAPAQYEPGPVILSPAPSYGYSTTQPTSTLSKATNVNKQDVLTMIKSGMSDAIIIRQLELHGMDRVISVAEVIELHQAGVSESVISAMQLAAPQNASKLTVSSPSSAAQSSRETAELNGPSVLLPPPPPRPMRP